MGPPAVSVAPYPWVKIGPKTVIARLSTSTGIGLPA